MSQPDLFTRRTRKLPPPLEFEVHCMVADLLQKWISPGWLWWHTPNGEARSKATAGRLKRMGVRPGVSDFLLLSPDGQLHALELKRKGERPNDDQAVFLAMVHAVGGRADWVDTFDGAVKILKDWGAVKVSLS
jgi:hypothetical protein